MVEPLTDTGEQLRQFLAVLSYYLPRTVSFMVFFPLLSKGLSSSLIKMSVGSVLVLYPAFASTTLYFSSMNPPAFTLITFLSEVVLGALLGLTIAFPYYAFKAFGALVDVYRGATFAAQATGTCPSRFPPRGQSSICCGASSYCGCCQGMSVRSCRSSGKAERMYCCLAH